MSSGGSSWNRFTRLKFSSKVVNKRLQKLERGSLRHARKFVTSRLDRLSSVRRNVSGWIILVMLMIGVGAAQWAASKDAYMITTYTSGGSYSDGVLGPLETLNPIFAKTSAERSAAKLLFAGLYKYDTTGNIKSDLAESMTVNQKETEYIVKLRKGLRWSDGKNITAADVVFTLKLLASPETRAEISGWQSIKFEKIDELTVKFILPSSYAPFAHALTFPVLPEHVLRGVRPSELREHPFGKSPVTSGPFAFRMLQNVTSDGSKKILYTVANDNYYGGTPKLERFQLYVYPSQNDIVKSLRTREITGTPELVYNNQSDEIKNTYSSESHTINNGVYALFNSTSQYLQSKSVRQALALSVNVSELRKLLSSETEEMNGPVLNNFLDEKVKPKGYSVKKAKGILDAAGWKVVGGVRQKDNQKLTLNIVAPKNENYEKLAKKLAEIWQKELNIATDVKIVDVNDVSQSILQNVLLPRNFDVLIYELAMGGDPDVYAYWHSSQATSGGLNFSNYNNAVADDALASGRSKLSKRQRMDRYGKFTSIWQQDIPAIALYQTKIDYIHLNSVKALAEDASLVSAVDRYTDVTYWSVNKTQVYKTP